MAEDRIDSRETSWKQLVPWTELFKTFQIALDLNKMLLAAAGILVMWAAWSLLALLFYVGYQAAPNWETWKEQTDSGYVDMHRQRLQWNLMHEAINLDWSGSPRYELEDVAETKPE